MADGNFDIQLKSIPLAGSFYYSNLGTITGLNNYFTIKFDAEKYKQQLKDKLLKEKNERLKKIQDLQSKKQDLLKKLSYLDLLKSRKIKLPIDSSKFNPSSLGIVNPLDTINLDQYQDSLQNTIHGNIPNIDTASYMNQIDSIQNSAMSNLPDYDPDDISNYWNDTLQAQKDFIENSLSKIDSTIDVYNKYKNLNIDSLRHETNLPKELLPSKLSNIMSTIKKFDIGMCYPNYSYFLVSRVPLRGVNVELNKGKWYGAFTHGKTVNNLFFTNNIIQNNLNRIRNLYNFFDFNNVDDGRKVTAAKFGYGNKNSTHLYTGFLYGLGKTSYLDTTSSSDNESNYVIELDGKLKISKHQDIEVFYGRSYVQVDNVNLGGSPVNYLLSKEEKTNAVFTRYNASFSKLGTQLKASFRYIDPFFRSFGVGFIRSDNMRYELKLKQKLGKKIKIGGFVRNEEDNLLKIYDITNTLFSYGVSADFRPMKKMVIKADFRPIVQQVDAGVDSLSLTNNNWILNVVGNYQNRFKKTYLSVTGVYSYYQLYNGELNNSYINYSLTKSLQINSKIQNDLIFNRFETTDTIGSPISNILQNDFTVRAEKLEVTGMLKSAFSNNFSAQLGYGIRANYKITKNVILQITGEKLVFGDFYNSLQQANLESFPYYFTSKIRFVW